MEGDGHILKIDGFIAGPTLVREFSISLSLDCGMEEAVIRI